MCGIYGFTTAPDAANADEVAHVLRQMDRAIFHRGPDDSGCFYDGHCAFGMRRLSIIDVGGGHQPIENENGSVRVVYNGEIYNYRALRNRLAARGHQFRTSSDTEVLVHSYEDAPETFVESLDGMFAFALWDSNSQTLTLGRDRLGIKPLYYAILPSGIVFGSELKSLLCHPEIEPAIELDALSHYVSFGSSPAEQSMLRGVQKLAPGRLLRYRRGRIEIRRYFSLGEKRPIKIDPKEAADEVRSRIFAAVKSHLIADVPVGAFLSGGIDSSTIVGVMTHLGARPKTFSIGFDDPDFDEQAHARACARHFGTEHHDLIVRPDAWQLAEELVWHLDEPLADVSAVPTYLVAKLAAEQVKVVLTGDGGDEIFAGYDRYAEERREAHLFDWLPQRARDWVARFADVLPDSARGKNYLRHLSLAPRLRYLDGLSLFPSHSKRALAGAALRDMNGPLRTRASELDGAPGDAISKLLYVDTTNYLPLDILTKVDRMTMAHSIEARPPLLDHHLVEFMFSLPSDLKLRGDTQKWILKRAVKDLLPQEIIHRRKRGFGVPIASWFRGPLRAPLEALLSDRTTRERGFFDARYLRSMADEHLCGRRDHALQLWSILMFELWCRRILDAPRAVSRRDFPIEVHGHA